MYQFILFSIKGNEHGGFFNAVTAGTTNNSLRCFGNISKLKGKGGNSGIGGSSNRFKRSFSEMGRVASQQYIFIGGDDNSRSAIGYNNHNNINGDNSNNGSFSRSISMKNNTITTNIGSNSNSIGIKSGNNKSSNNNNQNNSVSSFSLFAQISAKK